jgi:hypothetical protein
VVHRIKRALWMLLLRLPALLTGLSLLLATPASSQDSVPPPSGSPPSVVSIPFHPKDSEVDSLWAYNLKCSKVSPLPNHTQKNVTWVLSNLTERDPNHVVVGLWSRDTITLDTALVLNKEFLPAYRLQIMGHELMHQLFYYRVPVDSATDPRVREVPDSQHPMPYFGFLCHYRPTEPVIPPPPRRELPRRDDGRLVSAPTDYCASDITCLAWRMFVRLGDTPVGDLYIAHAGEYACIIDGWTAGKLKIGDRLVCDWRLPSPRNQ